MSSTISFLDFYSNLFDLDNSPLVTKLRFFPVYLLVNIQKGLTLPLMLFLMWYFQNYSIGCWVYAALHGSYGIIWVMKDMVFPDKGFRRNMDPIGTILLTGVLGAYYYIPYLMVSGQANQNPSPIRIFFCINMYVFGVLLMVLSDLQKYIRLEFKKGLINDYFLANNRNTNYFGEVLLYLSFATLVNEYVGYMILIGVWSTVFVSRIYIKEKSLMKKEGYQDYSKNSYLILFKFFRSDIINYSLYIVLPVVGVYCYYNLDLLVKQLAILHKIAFPSN